MGDREIQDKLRRISSVQRRMKKGHSHIRSNGRVWSVWKDALGVVQQLQN